MRRRSTGLTASLAIAEHVVGLMAAAGLQVGARRETARPQLANLGEASPRPYQQADVVAADPAYGTLVCHCERVSLGEIRDALRPPLGATSLAGVGRRTRAMNGRCQGFFCGAAVRDLVEGR